MMEADAGRAPDKKSDASHAALALERENERLRAELATANKVIDQHRSQLALAAYYLNDYTNDAEPALHAKRVIRNGLIDLDRVIGTRMVRPANGSGPIMVKSGEGGGRCEIFKA